MFPCVSNPVALASVGAAVYAAGSMHALEPPDHCVLMPLRSGRPLVSRVHATFCRIGLRMSEPWRPSFAARTASNSWVRLGTTILERHGFFGPPRECWLSRPSVQLQLTNACNLACSDCCTNCGDPGSQRWIERTSLPYSPGARDSGSRGSVGILGGEASCCRGRWTLRSAWAMWGWHSRCSPRHAVVDEHLARRTAELTRRGAELPREPGRSHTELRDGVSGAARFDTALAAVGLIAGLGGERRPGF